MRVIEPTTVPTSEVHRYLLSCVAPRPIAFVASNDGDGRSNLAPFSFFNAFGAAPPVVAFSPAFRGTDGSAKHTLENVLATGEFTISVVSYNMVEQMSLASADWPKGVDEFEVAGFNKVESHVIAPPGVAEAPMFMECVLAEHVSLGDAPGSGNLIIGEVKMFHMREEIFSGKYPDIDRLDLVARMGGPNYCRASGDAVFSLSKPTGLGVGYDAIPESARKSEYLSANDIGILASHSALPNRSQVEALCSRMTTMPARTDGVALETLLHHGTTEELVDLFLALCAATNGSDDLQPQAHQIVHALLRSRDAEAGWLVLQTLQRFLNDDG